VLKKQQHQKNMKNLKINKLCLAVVGEKNDFNSAKRYIFQRIILSDILN